jgi:hypothetical protein
VSWIQEDFGSSLETAIYTVDEPTPPFTVPANKGHEVMPYLTYVITNYHNLSDVTIFMHATADGWHNNDLLEGSSPAMLRALSSRKVIRDGYFNLRCHLSPGCSDQVHQLSEEAAIENPKLAAFTTAWRELFPTEAMPAMLRAPCCSQFAVSRERIRELPLKQYEFFRDWVLETKIEDSQLGRIWEYLWQYVWTGQSEVCPKAHHCYCDGFGLCFGGAEQYDAYVGLRREKGALEELVDKERNPGNEKDGRMLRAQEKIDKLTAKMKKLKEEAFKRGGSPENRAVEMGREWKAGDGF